MRTAATLGVALLAGCDSTAPETTIVPCEPAPVLEESATPVPLYMSPLGDDENSGGEEAPVATLGRVQEILRELRPAEDVVVKIRSDRGVYEGQSVVWDYFNAEHAITFEADPDSTYASFVQGEADTTFFVLRAAAGLPTNIRFRNLSIRGYAAGAIWFAGDAGKEGGWNGVNAITDCVMEDIGNEAQPERHICWAVVDLVNSRHNVIENCAFVNCANANTGRFPQDTLEAPLESGPNLPIIGVYLAHNSSCNTVVGCSFDGIKGDAVRIRDGSDGNDICRNSFRRTGWTAVCTMWYSYRRPFSSAPGECPSWNNTFHHNRAEGNWLCGPSLLFYDMRPEPSPRCPRPAGEGGYRIRLWENNADSCTP
jgi:hypothetical protein